MGQTSSKARSSAWCHAGAFVLFEQLYEGFLPARELPGDYYELNELESALVGRRTGEAYRLADIVSIRVVGVDEARGKVDLVPVHVEGELAPV